MLNSKDENFFDDLSNAFIISETFLESLKMKPKNLLILTDHKRTDFIVNQKKNAVYKFIGVSKIINALYAVHHGVSFDLSQDIQEVQALFYSTDLDEKELHDLTINECRDLALHKENVFYFPLQDILYDEDELDTNFVFDYYFDKEKTITEIPKYVIKDAYGVAHFAQCGIANALCELDVADIETIVYALKEKLRIEIFIFDLGNNLLFLNREFNFETIKRKCYLNKANIKSFTKRFGEDVEIVPQKNEESFEYVYKGKDMEWQAR